MKKNKWRFLKKQIAFAVMSSMCLLGTVTTFAQQTKTIDISPWAVETLNEGEKYGIFPVAWYQEGFKKPITKDKLQSLLTGVHTKLDTLEIKAKDNSVDEQCENITRGDVVKALYNELAQYTVIDTLNPTGLSAVEYFQKKGFLKGSQKGLDLEQPCTTEQAVVLASKLVEDTFASLDAGAKGLSYKVTNGKNTLYFVGSVHLGSTNMYPLRKDLKDLFKSADGLFVEVNLMDTQDGLQKFMKIAQYGDGTTLKDHISEATYKTTLEALKKLGLPEETYVQFKPWSIANDLTSMASSNSSSVEEASTAANLGVDLYFTTNALLQGKQVMELEGYEYQANLFDGLSNEAQDSYLNAAAQNIIDPKDAEGPSAGDFIKEWQKQWYNGDHKGFITSYAKALEANENDEFSTMLLGQRDKDMAEKLSTVLEKENNKTYFVVVGAGHLEVANTVLDQLKAKGYTVTSLYE